MAMDRIQGWRSVMVPPPNPLAAIGGALKRAFPVTMKMRRLDSFAALLGRIDRR